MKDCCDYFNKPVIIEGKIVGYHHDIDCPEDKETEA